MDYLYNREKFNPEYSINYILSIQLSLDGFCLYIANKESVNTPVYLLSKRLKKPGIRSMINELKKFHDFDALVFHRTIITYHTHSFLLIPDEFYNQDLISDYFLLLQSEIEEVKTFVSIIPVLRTKLIFNVPLEILSILNDKFPQTQLLHSACPSLQFGIHKTGAICVINHFGTSISITVFKDKELYLFNIFSVKDENDLLYFVSNSLQSCNLERQVTDLYLIGKEEDSPEYLIISKFISEPLKYLPDLKEFNSSDFPVNILFNHLEGLNCAL